MANFQEPQGLVVDNGLRRARDDVSDEKGMAAKVSIVTVAEAEDERQTVQLSGPTGATRSLMSSLLFYLYTLSCFVSLPTYETAHWQILREIRSSCISPNSYVSALSVLNGMHQAYRSCVGTYNLPIILTLVFANFIKAVAIWKLERGTTVGSLQHLLGSRSLVSSCFTPFKLRTWSVVVPALVGK